jgi:hypothetical protein
MYAVAVVSVAFLTSPLRQVPSPRCVYRFGDTDGERRETRQVAGRSPLYITGFGARVARQRCCILRASRNRRPCTRARTKLSVGIRRAPT